jgi:hypothetical protein
MREWGIRLLQAALHEKRGKPSRSPWSLVCLGPNYTGTRVVHLMGKVAHRANETPTCEGESALSAREPWLLVVFGVLRFSNAVIGVWLLFAADS